MRLPALFFVSVLLIASVSASAKNPPRPRVSDPADFAYIINTGNARIRGYRIYVGASGKLQAVYLSRSGAAHGRRTGRMTSYLTRRFFADLKTVGALDALPTGRQKITGHPDAYPGIRITLRHRGRQSPDMRQVSSTEGRQLYQDVKQAIQVLRLPVPDTP